MDDRFQEQHTGATGDAHEGAAAVGHDNQQHFSEDAPEAAFEPGQGASSEQAYSDEVLDTVRQADETARQAGRQVLVGVYERNRLVAIAALESAAARAQLAAVGMKWDPERYPEIVEHVLEAERSIQAAKAAIDTRLQLAAVEGHVMAARGETVQPVA